MIEESDKHESRQEFELVMPREVMGLVREGLWAAIGTSMRDGSARVWGNRLTTNEMGHSQEKQPLTSKGSKKKRTGGGRGQVHEGRAGLSQESGETTRL